MATSSPASELLTFLSSPSPLLTSNLLSSNLLTSHPLDDAETGEAESHQASPFIWILEHLIMFPGTYELPLQVAYDLNRGAITAGSQPSSPVATVDSGLSGSFGAGEAGTAAVDLEAALVAYLAAHPMPEDRFPPAFAASFARRCFPPELALVDFDRALEAIDHVRSLEMRRRAEVTAVAARLGFGGEEAAGGEGRSAAVDQAVERWVRAVADQGRRCESYYTQVYVGLRRWVMINELCIEPFNRANCGAMLNTLYPPLVQNRPTRALTPQALLDQRNTYARYIHAVELNGAGILSSLKKQDARPARGEETGWPCVREVLDLFLRGCERLITDCAAVTDAEGVYRLLADEQRHLAQVSRNSAVSAGSSERRLAPTTTKDRSSSRAEGKAAVPATASARSGSGGSTLERIARECRRLFSAGSKRRASRSGPDAGEGRGNDGGEGGRRSTDQADRGGDQPGPARGARARDPPRPQSPDPPKTGNPVMRALKKMKSTSAIRDTKEIRQRNREILGRGPRTGGVLLGKRSFSGHSKGTTGPSTASTPPSARHFRSSSDLSDEPLPAFVYSEEARRQALDAAQKERARAAPSPRLDHAPPPPHAYDPEARRKAFDAALKQHARAALSPRLRHEPVPALGFDAEARRHAIDAALKEHARAAQSTLKPPAASRPAPIAAPSALRGVENRAPRRSRGHVSRGGGGQQDDDDDEITPAPPLRPSLTLVTNPGMKKSGRRPVTPGPLGSASSPSPTAAGSDKRVHYQPEEKRRAT